MKIKKRKDGRVKKQIDGKVFYANSERELFRKIYEYQERKEKGVKFAEISDEWWKDAYERISPTVVRSYKKGKERADEFFGDAYVREITTSDVNAYLFFLGKKQGLAKKTVLNQKIVLSQIFKYAISCGELNCSPCDNAQIPRGLAEKKRHAATLSDEEIILNSADIWIMPYMALMTGLRIGELLALRWGDVNFDKNIINVNKSVYYISSRGHIKSPKTEAGYRQVPLLPELKEKLLPLRSDSDIYISSGKKTLMNEKQYRCRFEKFKQETGISATFHQLRKSFASIAVRADIQPKVLQSIMGHKNISTTLDIYAEVREDALQEAADKLTNVFAKK